MSERQDAQHTAAAARSARLDRSWFDRRPGVFLRLRHSLAFEWSPWGQDTHREKPFVVVMQEEDGALSKQAFFAHQMPPQDPASLSVLWDLLEDGVPTLPGDPLSPADPDHRKQVQQRLASLQARIGSLQRRGASVHTGVRP